MAIIKKYAEEFLRIKALCFFCVITHSVLFRRTRHISFRIHRHYNIESRCVLIRYIFLAAPQKIACVHSSDLRTLNVQYITWYTNRLKCHPRCYICVPTKYKKSLKFFSYRTYKISIEQWQSNSWEKLDEVVLLYRHKFFIKVHFLIRLIIERERGGGEVSGLT